MVRVRRETPHRALRGVSALALVAALSACTALDRPIQANDPQGKPEGELVELVLVGNDSVPRRRLFRVLQDRLIDFSRNPGSRAVMEDVRFAVEDVYRGQGHPDVVVTVASMPAEDRQLLEVTIAEGTPVTVGDLEITGGEAFVRDELLKFWLRKSSGALGLGPPLFVESDLRGFAQSLQIYLRGEGYLEAKVPPPDFARREAEPIVDVRVAIDTGPRYVVGDVGIVDAVRAALGDTVPSLDHGEAAEARRIEGFRSQIVDGLRGNGRPDPHIRLDLQRRIDGEGHFVDVAVEGDPGPLAVVVGVDVEGLDRTDESVVRAQLAIPIGEPFDGETVDASLRNLYLTGLFQRVDVRNDWVGDEAASPRSMRVHLTFVEQETRTVEALLGWGSYERARGKLRFEEANLFGTGRGLVVEGRLSQRGWRALATVTDPNFLRSGLTLSVSADALRREEPSFLDRAYGGTVALGRQITDHWIVRGGYSYRLHDGLTSNVLDPAAAIESYTEGSPFLESRYDTRDSLIYPRSGYQIALQIDSNAPAFGSDLDFTRARFAASAYLPFNADTGLAFRTDQGLLWPRDRSETIPLQERFYNGGENTVRSYRESLLGPLDTNGRPLGGEFRNVFGVELRSRLIGMFEGSLFVDAGNVGTDIGDFGLSDISYAVGAGLRIALPIGPIRFDAGVNPEPRDGDRDWVLHISVGYPF
jgi:outer membrane protein insertion porin family